MNACRTACFALLMCILAHWHNLARADWRDQIVYFVLLDRFDDGDPSNNWQGPRHLGIYDPRRSDRYSGGDLKGLERRLDYIAGLGMSAVWISPPVRQQWWEPKTQS
ncbi:MAG: alpha-amylase family glycosyl hydrolase, partial [Burkholderiaceae bacterium]